MSNTRQETASGEALVQSARQLLMQTTELPEGKRELLAVIGEYRRALHALVVGNGSVASENAGGQPR